MKLTKLKIITLVLAGFVISSCTEEKPSTKSNTKNNDNICNILKNNPKWSKSLKDTQTKYNISPAFVMGLIRQESNFKSDARSKISSAYGYSQALDNTWKSYQKSVSPSANRTSFDDSVKFVGWYMSGMSKSINVKMNNYSSLYLAYMIGPTGFKRYKNGTFKNRKNLESFLDISQKVKTYTDNYIHQLKSCQIK